MSVKRYSDQELFERLTAIVYEEMQHGDLSMPHLASRLSMSASQLNRRVRTATGSPVTTFVMQVRLREACRLLEQPSQYTVSDVARLCGFADPAHFAHVFRRVMGLSPTQYMESCAQNRQAYAQYVQDDLLKKT